MVHKDAIIGRSTMFRLAVGSGHYKFWSESNHT